MEIVMWIGMIIKKLLRKPEIQKEITRSGEHRLVDTWKQAVKRQRKPVPRHRGK